MKPPPLKEQREIFHRSILPANADDALASQLWHVFRAGVMLGSKGKIPKFEASLCQGSAYPVIPASVIWDRWQKVKACFGNKPEAWMRLIRIAAAGPVGVSHADLFPHTNGWNQIHTMMKADLVQVHREPREPGQSGAPKHRITITWKGYRFLRLTPARGEFILVIQDGTAQVTPAPASPSLPIS